MMKPVVPIFFSVNDAYSPFLATAIASIQDNASDKYTYRIHILTDDISEENRSRLQQLAAPGFELEFFPLSSRIKALPGVSALEKHCFGAFASLTIYFRLFIPVLFPPVRQGHIPGCRPGGPRRHFPAMGGTHGQ